MNNSTRYIEIIKFLQQYIYNTQCKGFCIEISNKKDSIIVAKLLCDAIGKENVCGITIPCNSDLIKVLEYLDIEHINIDIESICDSALLTLSNIKDTLPNQIITSIIPRLKMTTMYAIAQTKEYDIVGTGNASEEFIGWYTKWGEMACDINPIAHLLYTDVIKLGDYMKIPHDLIHTTSIDELIVYSDEENFSFSYEKLDAFIKHLTSSEGQNPTLEYDRQYSDSDHTKMFEMYKASRYKQIPYTL